MQIKFRSFKFALLLFVLCSSLIPHAQATPVCQTRELSIDFGDSGGGMGTMMEDLVLTNSGKQVCSLTGYPSAVALDDKGRIVREISFQQFPAIDGHSVEVREIHLQPGWQVRFQLTIRDGTGFDNLSFCKRASRIRVTPPQNKKPFREPLDFNTCTPDVGISPVVAEMP